MVSSAGVLSPGFTSSPPASVVASGTAADVSSVASVDSAESVTSVGSVASVAFSVVSGSFSSSSHSAFTADLPLRRSRISVRSSI